MIVVNATVLSNLARVTWLRILKELFGEVLIPLPVYEEILKGIDAGYDFLKSVDEIVEKEDWITLEFFKDEHEKRAFKTLLDSVGYGEAAGIAIAKERSLHFFSDDRVARETAKGFKKNKFPNYAIFCGRILYLVIGKECNIKTQIRKVISV